jgi:hypothetical protein
MKSSIEMVEISIFNFSSYEQNNGLIKFINVNIQE